ncbi:MAG TPA: hypothetical protein DDW52_15545 [Planctomycetaceae bacterium]|nr:hypothetical protein [Planctomycetaceae bacterium]
MSADELFKAALKRRSLDYTLDGDGLYIVQIGDVSATINLDNVRRNYERDNDAEAVEEFAKHLDVSVFDKQPSWEQVKPWIRYSLEPSDYVGGFDDTVHEIVTAGLVKVFIFTLPDGASICWISHDMVANWSVSQDELIAVANTNIDQLVNQTKLEVQQAGEVELGMLSLDDTPFKASLILSPQFRSLVSAEFGWPVFVVAPARDFVYVLSHRHRDFLGRLGGVVLREYNESGHSITADVLQIGDDGVAAIGSFAPRADS